MRRGDLGDGESPRSMTIAACDETLAGFCLPERERQQRMKLVGEGGGRGVCC